MNSSAAALKKMALVGFLIAALALPLATLIGFLIHDSAGAYGAAIGMGLSVVFIGLTSVTALLTMKLKAQTLGLVVLTSWLVKIVLLLVVLASLRDADFYHRPTLLASMLVGLVGYLTIEALIVQRSRILYVEP